MKAKIIIGICIFLLIPLVSAQMGGGGTRELTQEEFYEMSGNFTKCLIDNCDYFCKQYGLEQGYYYRKGKCWCESYTKTEHGEILSDDGWIEIEKCSQELIMISKEEQTPNYENITRQRDILLVAVGIFFFIIISLSWVIIYKLKKK